MKAILALEDGSVFHGEGFGAIASACGEVCFNTSMTGYQEILTDPSYKGQIVAMRHAVGNTRTGSLSWGADILLGNGRVIFAYLHDLAKDNADKLEALQ